MRIAIEIKQCEADFVIFVHGFIDLLGLQLLWVPCKHFWYNQEFGTGWCDLQSLPFTTSLNGILISFTGL